MNVTAWTSRKYVYMDEADAELVRDAKFSISIDKKTNAGVNM